MQATKCARLEIEALMSDPRLASLNEMHRAGNDLLDVVKLTENQHSDILSWLMDAREAHGQGDTILRDLMLHATSQADQLRLLAPHSDTADFFSRWPASRIRTTSFGSAFTTREFGLGGLDRADLYIVDEHNHFILVIENKAGTYHSADQLKRYLLATKGALSRNKRMKGFSVAFIGLDMNFDAEGAEHWPCSDTWLHIGYEWLETSAKRALIHVERGNAVAGIVASYCAKCYQWEDPRDKDRRVLAAEVYGSYPSAVQELSKYAHERHEVTWFASKGERDPLLLFALQNRATIRLFSELTEISSIEQIIKSKLPELSEDSFESLKRHVYIRPQRAADLARADKWVMWVWIERLHTTGKNTPPAFNVKIGLRESAFRCGSVAEGVKRSLGREHPNLNRGASTRIRYSPAAQSVSFEEAIQITVAQLEILDRLLTASL